MLATWRRSVRKRQLTAVAYRNIGVSKSTDIGGTLMQRAIPREVTIVSFIERRDSGLSRREVSSLRPKAHYFFGNLLSQGSCRGSFKD